MQVKTINQDVSSPSHALLLKTEVKAQIQLYRFTLLITCFAFCVAVLGAYTRLTDAGLGCPDWPGCYGRLIMSNVDLDFSGFNLKKAWTEMAHRYFAGTLGLLIFFLSVRCFMLRKLSFLQTHPFIFKISLLLVAIVFLQALLGMWTVTLKLLPVIVMAHLLLGFTMLSLLYWLSLALKNININVKEPISIPTTSQDADLVIYSFKFWSRLGILVLALQLFLGGWTSANYAALVCLDFPTCFAGQYFPTQVNLGEAFNLFSERNTASITIHMFHRIGALITAIILYGLFLQIYRHVKISSIRRQAFVLALLLSLQIFLGIMNVMALLPLSIALLHHAVAALLLLALINLNYQLYHYEK